MVLSGMRWVRGIEKKVDNFAAEVMQQAGLTEE